MGLGEGERGTHMSYLPNENREKDSIPDARRLRENPEERTHGSGQTHSRAFEDWLNNYRNRLDRVLRGAGGQRTLLEDDGPSCSPRQ
jgi:hypothetical protein